MVQLVVLGNPALHLSTTPQAALAPLPEHAAPVFAPEVHVLAVLHCALVVQLVVLGSPALHLSIAPHVALVPLTVHEAPVLVPVVQAPVTLH